MEAGGGLVLREAVRATDPPGGGQATTESLTHQSPQYVGVLPTEGPFLAATPRATISDANCPVREEITTNLNGVPAVVIPLRMMCLQYDRE